MTALVTGATGFLGGALVERLLAAGQKEIRCFARPGSNTARLDALTRQYPDAKLEWVHGNLLSLADCQRAVEGAEVIYHLAAGLTGSAADLFLNSCVASQRLLEAVIDRRPARVVLVSSFGVYGAAGVRRGGVIDENTPLEPHPERRDTYSHSKLRQEQLFREYQERYGFELVVLRPGVIYGPGGGGLSARVGLQVGGCLLHLGGRNLLPLSYVENCAEAVALAGRTPEAAQQTYNVHDDDLPTSAAFLRAYRREAAQVRALPVPYPALLLLSRLVEGYSQRSRGQIPPVFTPYKTASLWKGHRYSNARLKSLGWRQLVPTAEGMRRTFAHLRSPAGGPAA